MADRYVQRVRLAGVFRSVRAATQWRLLLLWVLLLLVPTLVVSLPLARMLGGILDHSVHAPAWAEQFSAVMFGDTLATITRGGTGWLGAGALLGLMLTLLLSPFLNGMVVGSARARRALGFGHLLQCGIVEYGRMFRLMLWSLAPYAVMAALAGVGFGMAHEFADKAVLESDARRASTAALSLLVVLWLLAQAVVQSARAAFMADHSLRSATRAYGRACMQLLRRPFSTLLCYVLLSALGYAVTLALGVARVGVPAVGWGGLVLAMLLGQLIVLAMVWTHVARLFALAEVARSLPPPRRRVSARAVAEAQPG